jgi:peptidoglycan/LPS O-acetylase OafA/YrhL
MRYKSLDSLRGLAAFAVVIHHCLMTLPRYNTPVTQANISCADALLWLLSRTPFHMFVAGTAAVMLFFVLSGFVLTLALNRATYGYMSFLSQRFIRLFPPFAASILLSAVLYFWVQPHLLPFATAWFNQESWTTAPSVRLVAGHLGMIQYGEFTTLNNVMWSLTVEIRAAVLFPMIFWLARDYPGYSLLAAFGLMLVATTVGTTNLFPAWVDSWFLTVRVLWLFIAGSIVAQNHSKIIAIVSSLKRPLARFFWIAALVAFGLPVGLTLSIILAGAGSIVIIMMTISRPRALSVLEWPPFLYLGKISYSLYLVHLPVLLAFVHAFARADHIPIVLGMGVLCSLVIAHLLHILVEQPCHRLARAVSAIHLSKQNAAR